MSIRKFRKYFRYYNGKFLATLCSKEIRGPVSRKHLCAIDPEKIRAIVFRNLAMLVPPPDGDPAAESISRFPSSSLEAIVREADGICAHKIPLYEDTYSLGEQIDWHKDYVSGFKWPLDYYGDAKIINLDDDSDIKFPWELSRFHHAVTLGKAYWFTRDEKYAGEFLSQMDSWIEQNPPNKGINWNCAMEVALRAINLLWAYAFFHGSPRLDDGWHDTLLHLIHAHGERIYSNPENNSLRSGNHYLANLAGLAYIACLLPVFSRSGRWRTFAIEELRKEMELQVHPDGTSFEGSIPYHGLVAEILFHSAYILGKFGQPVRTSPMAATEIRKTCLSLLGPAYMGRLEKMLEYILTYTKPDGTFPQIGDNDSGRVVRLGGSAEGTNSHLHLLSLGGELFNREDFRSACRQTSEATGWLFPTTTPSKVSEVRPPGSARFGDAGVYILRDRSDYLAIRCGPLGCGGKGTHNHNDNLGFELCAGGVTYLVDPGTYNYSRDPRIRNRFRSNLAHNTLCIDRVEQNGFSDRDMFVLLKNSEARVLSWQSDAERDRLVGEVTYEALAGGVLTHVRQVEYEKKPGQWTVRDDIRGVGERTLQWNFILSPGIGMEFRDAVMVLRRAGEAAGLVMSLNGVEGFRLSTDRTFFSPAYESKIETDVLRIIWKGVLPATSCIRFSPCSMPVEVAHQ